MKKIRYFDPKGRTNNGIYLGERGSIRYGYNKSESRPIGGNGSLENLERYLMKIRDTPIPEPLLEQIKRENPITIARRNVHAIVQQLTLEQLEKIQADYGGAS